MYSLLRMPHAATGIEHSLYGNFFGPWEKNLLVAGANVLRVFRLMPESNENPSAPKMRLECLASFSLHGEIMGLEKVTLPGSARDTFLLSFTEAKVSVVEYDPATHDLKTVSLHIFEDEQSREGYVHNYSIPYLRADPDGRCAAMLVFGRKIVILPFKRIVSAASDPDDPTLLEATETVSGKEKVMASYTLDLQAVIQTNKVDNIIDIQFLHGYNQPTLCILYEPLKTYSGRIAVRKDTCRLDVVTLDVKEKVAAFIWTREVLPFDCVGALPVPKPIGGTLVFAVNALFYLNQGIPPYAVSLNSLGDSTMENVVKNLDGVKLTLDCAQAQFMTPERAVISLKGGELYVLSLLLDGMRSVRGFHFDRAAASVLTTCLTVCEDRYLFLGSRLGNSLLLQFTEKDIGDIVGLKEPPSKKKKLDSGGGNGDWLASDVGEIQDIDLEVYGGSADDIAGASTSRITSYSFEVCDSLLNVGPCGNVSMGEPAFLSEEFAAVAKADPDVELVSTSGHGKNGALCVLQQTIRPQVVTTFELPGVTDMWTVVGDTPGSAASNGHAFLILSRAESTMVLQTGQEINELDKSGFLTKEPTVFCGNLGDNKYIVQVAQKAVRLLNGTELLQNLTLDLGSPIIHVSCADPHLLALTEDGQLVLLSLDASMSRDGSAQLTVVKANLSSNSKMTTLCAYKDMSGLFTANTPSFNARVDHSTVVASSEKDVGLSSAAGNANEAEDEDDLLYGDSAPDLFTSASVTTAAVKSLQEKFNKSHKQQPSWTKYLKHPDATYWAIGLRENGNLEIMSLPDFTLKYVVNNFNYAPDVLSDALFTTEPKVQLPEYVSVESMPTVNELMMVGLGGNKRRPLLLAKTSDHEILAYEVYPFYERLENIQLRLRFKKIRHGLLLRERKSKSKKAERGANTMFSRNQLRYFSDVAGYEGVFICGPYPHWLLLTGRGELRTHPMGIDASVPCFAAFHNVNCPQGFIYFNRKGELRICVLPTHLSYDAPWPVRKVPLRCTPHFVAYHLESKTYAVVTSTSETTNKVWKFNGDDKELVTEDRDDRFPWPAVDTFHIQLFSPLSWEAIPGTKVQLDDWERCTSMKHLYLTSEGLHSGEKGYIVCSTAYCYGEDVTPRGYIRIYDIIEVNPEPGQPLTKNKIKTVYDKEQKGPITAVAAVNGYLVATVGQKIYIFQFKNKDLYGVAFIDSQVYIHQLVTLKNFILVGDVMKSVDLLQFQQDYRTLAVISRDPKPLEVYSAEYVVDNNLVAFAVTDADKNLILFMYQPEARESNGGQKLVRRADLHLGQHVNHMFRIRAKITDPSAGGRLLTGWEKRHVLWFATLDGGFGHLLPCSEKTYRRLLMLQNVLVTSIPHAAGLNPKAFRTLRQRRKELLNPSRGIIDGELVFQYTDLSIAQKAEVARKIGTKFSDILDDLAELDRMAAHF